MKNSYVFTFFTHAILFISCSMMVLNKTYAMQFGNSPVGDPMGQMPQEDYNAMLELLEQLDPETLEELAKIGEEFIKEAQERGENPYELLGLPADFDKQFETEMPTIAVPTTPTEPKAPSTEDLVDHEKIALAKKMLESLELLLNSISQRTVENRQAREKLSPLFYYIEDLIFFVKTLNQKHLLKHLVSNDFTILYEKFSFLENQLQVLVPYLVFDSMAIETQNPYTTLGIDRDAQWADIVAAYQQQLTEKDPQIIAQQLKEEGLVGEQLQEKMNTVRENYAQVQNAYAIILQQEQAKQALDKILDILRQIIEKQNIIEEIKKLLQNYEPEALRLKEEQEKLEATARQEQEEALRRRPQYTPPIFDALGYGNGGVRPSYDNYLTTTPTPSLPFPNNYSSPDQAGSASRRSGETSSPTTPTKDKEPKKPAKPGEAPAKDGSDKDEKTKKSEPKKDPKVDKKMEAIEKELKNLVLFITDGPEVGGPSQAPKVLFTNFTQFLTAEIKTPYNANDNAIKKAKSVKDALVEMTKKINTIKKELHDPELTAQQKSAVRYQTNIKLQEYQKSYINKHLQELLIIHISESINEKTNGLIRTVSIQGNTVPVVNELAYALLGSEFENIDATTNKIIKDLNPSAENFIGSFLQTYKKLLEEVKRKR